ncbi:gluconate 2-dehydrogenase subunit 3 family protein [Curtobacterium sp. RRHDQ10]|uniref:gluconate 2-dehydrogenase subunit 3 family protein n=1 Tax=Curtobacterium phyllosphaerae TaxID=3413379 RepID=UPI003BF0F0B8
MPGITNGVGAALRTGPIPTADTDDVALTFFTDAEAITVEAVGERIIPADGDEPGATDAGVVYYIDRAVAGFSTRLQRPYRLGLRELDRWCVDTHGAPFRNLDTLTQDAVVAEFLGDPVEPSLEGPVTEPNGRQVAEGGRDTLLLRRLFAILREHVIEGYFCDPAYGGNRGTVGWKLVGFPGAQWGYTAAQMQPGFDAGSIPITTLSDLRRQLAELPPNEHYTSAAIAPEDVITIDTEEHRS